MHPILFNLGPFPVHTYGFMIALGFLTAMSVIKRNALYSKLDAEKILDLSFWTLIVGFIGARTVFVLTRLDSYLQDPISVFKIWEGGLVFFGGPLAATPFVVWYLKKHKMNLWRSMDAMIPGLVIAHSLGRVGCLAAGCCYGKPTGTDFGVKLYSDLVDRALQGIPLHPTQIYESVAMALLFIALMIILRRKKFDGQVILTYFIAYPIIRSVIEIFRGDSIRGFLIEDILSTSQAISIAVFMMAVSALVYRLKQVNIGVHKK